MSDAEPKAKNSSFSHCTVQLNAVSLMLLTGFSGLCGGIVWALILYLGYFLGIFTLESYKSPVNVLIGFPVIGAFGSAMFALLGYPIYNWVCKAMHGQNLRGIFFDPKNQR